MIPKWAYAAGALIAWTAATTITIEARYEKASVADQRHEILAADRESGDLGTRLELIRIRLERFRDLANLRPLTEAEQIELRSLEAEQAALLNRLASKG